MVTRSRNRVLMNVAVMSFSFRRDVIAGIVSGLVGGLVLSWTWRGQGMLSTAGGPSSWTTLGTLFAHLLSVAFGGAAFGALFRYQPESPAVCASGGLLFGLLWWMVGPLTLGAMWMGHAPTWSVRDAGAAFPSLVGYLLYGGSWGAASTPW
jgi:hypothetical protein